MTLAPQITVRNIEPAVNLEPVVLKEIAVLERFFKRVMSCRVLIEKVGKRKLGGLYNVRIDLGVPNEELVVEHLPNLHRSLRERGASKTTKQSEIRRPNREVHRAIHQAFQEMRRRLQDYVRRIGGRTKRHDLQSAAKVARLFGDHGFLEAADGREIYFHRNSVLNGRFDQLRAGSAVHFAEESGEKGPQASTVSLTHPARQGRKIRETVPT
jgi:cold shock CspA family protein/ribosome-associated translation inhibitor RaiA